MMKQLLLMVLICLFSIANADELIKGKLVTESLKPIPYANIGILNMAVGTTSLEDGSFQIMIPNNLLDAELIFSSLGYERKSIPVRDLLQSDKVEIVLKEQVIVLEEVMVQQKRFKLKNKLVGPSPSGNERMNFKGKDQSGGAMITTLIDPKPASYAIKNVRINIAENTWMDSKFRLRLLSVNDSTSLPENDLIQKNIMVNCNIEEGWLIVDLEEYHIFLEEDKFFLGLELIEDPEIRRLQVFEDSVRGVHYKKLYDRGAKGIEQITKETKDGPKVVGYVAKNKGVQALTKSLKEAGVEPSPRTNFKISSKQASKYPCYTRSASFDQWKIRPFTLVAKALIEYEK